MLYKFLRVLMTFGLKFYFRRIEIHGLKNIPKGVPVVFACNHPSSFMEACLLACFQPRVLHFLVRGDVFQIRWLRPLLEYTNQIPIFRFKDGYANLKKNQETFSRAHDILQNNGAIIIYPEGSTVWTKRLRPLQRGLARMVFGAMESRGMEDILIVPVGINYSDVLQWRSDVAIGIGTPISVRSYISAYRKDGKETIRRLTDDVYVALQPLVVHFDHYADSHDYLLLARMAENRTSPMLAEAMKVSRAYGESEGLKDIPPLSLSDYTYDLSGGGRWVHFFKTFLSLLPGLIGLVLVGPILRLGDGIVQKNKMSSEFVAPAKLAILLTMVTVICGLAWVLSLIWIPQYAWWILLVPVLVQAAAFLVTEGYYWSGYFGRKKFVRDMTRVIRHFSNNGV